jgi:glycosyltransferase involved in cell wall biosynthesis
VLVDANGVPDTVARLASDRGGLLEMRRAAQRAAAGFRWSDVAERTIEVYERAVAQRRRH